MLAHRIEVLLRFGRSLERRRHRARPARLNVILEQALLAGPQLDAEARALELRGHGVGGNELVEAVAPGPAPLFCAEIAQHRRQDGKGYQALLAIDDLEIAGFAVAGPRQIAASGVEQQYRAQKV